MIEDDGVVGLCSRTCARSGMGRPLALYKSMRVLVNVLRQPILGAATRSAVLARAEAKTAFLIDCWMEV